MGVDGAGVGVLEELREIFLCGLLQRAEGSGFPAECIQVPGAAHISADLADEALEWDLADEEHGAPLEHADLLEGDGAGATPCGSLRGRRGLVCSVRGGCARTRCLLCGRVRLPLFLPLLKK